MMRLLTYILLFTTTALAAQKPHCVDPAFDREVQNYLNMTVPVMDVDELMKRSENVIILDGREKEEYDVSRIPGARHVGYNDFDQTRINDISRDAPIVVYCSIGYRSEKLGEQLQKMGFTDVHNLYGSIFEWANRGYPLETPEGNPTTTLHTYSRKWSKWVTGDDIQKVW